ncbi:MAG: hypothetical protein ACJ77K_13070 [Bacteroidia bacterium]
MRIVDFIGQTFMFLLGLCCLLMGKEGLVFIAFLQFFMGAWQIISAIVTSVNRKHGDPSRALLMRIYWIAVGVYFIILAGLGIAVGDIAIVWFFTAWLIAIYYFIITIRIAFTPQKPKQFPDAFNE